MKKETMNYQQISNQGSLPDSHLVHLQEYVKTDDFVCVFGKRVMEKENYMYISIPEPMDSTETIRVACEGLYAFIEKKQIPLIGASGRISPDYFASFVLSFPQESTLDENEASKKLFGLLVGMHKYDVSLGNIWAKGVSNNPKSTEFSFSIGGEAWFCPFFYPGATMPARRAPHTYLVFNSHRLFDALRENETYESTRELVRTAEKKRFGFVPELLGDFGKVQEFPQYLLPHHENVDLVWNTLHEVGGDEPFGAILDEAML